MIRFYPFPLLGGLGILIIFLILLRRRGLAYLFCFTLFGFYLLFVVSAIVFPIPLPERIGQLQPPTYIFSRMNLIPFNFGGLFNLRSNIIFEQTIGNILLTMPFGFGIPFLVRFKPKHFPWLAIGAGLTTETAQLGVSLLIGCVYRSVDINDVLLNTAGALLGYALFRGFAWLYVAISKRIKIRQSGLFAYVYEVANVEKTVQVLTPRLKNIGPASDFKMEVTEDTTDNI
jgi:glycopeptide antibiotics resistance protein